MNGYEKKVLVLDDDVRILSIVESALVADGYEVICAQSLEDFDRSIRSNSFDLLLLDIGVPRLDGMELAKRIRSKSEVGLIFITGRSDEFDRVLGLEIGADDYIVKPFSIRELRARAKVVLRRSWGKRYGLGAGSKAVGAEPTGEAQFQEFTLNFQRRSVVDADGSELDLTSLEFDTLAVFAKRLGEIVTRDDLMREVKAQSWNPLDRTVDNIISRLRRKLSPPANREAHIKTVHGRGYVLVN